jgi:outer membrane biosynthesis protein TonB
VAAFIDKDGKIAELRVVEGNPFLIDAALESIQKWRHRSTFLTGEPVEVATQIIVHFRLNN